MRICVFVCERERMHDCVSVYVCQWRVKAFDGVPPQPIPSTSQKYSRVCMCCGGSCLVVHSGWCTWGPRRTGCTRWARWTGRTTWWTGRTARCPWRKVSRLRLRRRRAGMPMCPSKMKLCQHHTCVLKKQNHHISHRAQLFLWFAALCFSCSLGTSSIRKDKSKHIMCTGGCKWYSAKTET